jgi:hypothetical protein
LAASRPETTLRAHEIISLLSLLSASLRNKQPLPPYLKGPQHFTCNLSEEIRGSDSDASVLSLSNINEPGFRAVAVIEVAQMFLVDSVASIVKHVRELVGEVDFTYRIKSESVGTSSSALANNAAGKQKAH